MQLVALLLSTLLVVSASGDDWSTAQKQFRKDVVGGNPLELRLRTVKQAAEYKELAATEFLVRALEESCAESRVLEKRFTELTEGLGDNLHKDVRLIPVKSKEALEERRAIGKRILEEDKVSSLVVEKLAARQDDSSKQHLASLPAKARDWRLQTRLIEVLGLMSNEAARDGLHKLLRHKDPRVRMITAQALGSVGDDESVGLLSKTLQDEDQQVRLFVIESLRALGRPAAVPHLINALTREEGLLRRELSLVLEELTGQKHGVDAHSWSRWWEDNKAELLAAGRPVRVSGKTKDEADPFSYYGIKTYSKKVVFVLDISDSMNDSAEETVVPESGIPKRTGNLRPKILVARDQLTRAIVDLPEDSMFNIVVYNKYVGMWKPAMLKASKKNKNDALSYVLNLKAQEATNIMGAFDSAFTLAGGNLGDKYYPSQVDTIFFLTDGKATEGRIQDPQEIADEVKRRNKIGKIQIHTIGVGYLHDRPFLERLATENGGTYVNIQ